MTEEENNKALELARKYSDNKDKIDGFYNGYVAGFLEKYKQVEKLEEEKVAREIIDRELLKKNDELEAQIEKMKCFKNCLAFDNFKCPVLTGKTIKSCNGCKHWQLKE